LLTYYTVVAESARAHSEKPLHVGSFVGGSAEGEGFEPSVDQRPTTVFEIFGWSLQTVALHVARRRLGDGPR